MTTAVLALNLSPNTMQWFPINTAVGTSLAIAATNNGQVILRSNATVAMTDTLPTIANYYMVNGWWVKIKNIDASASITLSPPTGSTINGASTLTIAAATVVTIGFDGLNFWTV